ncbi:MAG: hypothetical protein J7513_09040 [Solirubrobacteraceae bacterium]|nr:hypothetical protein [Solirubrobacteraceae bacterium]
MEAAVELAVDGSIRREALGLFRGGTQARIARGQLGLRAIDLRAGLDRACVPVAALVVAIWSMAAITRILGTASPAPDVRGLTIGSALLLAELAVLIVAISRRQRLPALLAAAALLVQGSASAVWMSARGGTVTAAPSVPLHLGPWWFGPSLIWSALPFLALLVAACVSMAPAAPRVPGIPRPVRESALVRAATLLVPAGVLGVALVTAPQLMFEAGRSGSTTEIPGILALMLIVAALWVAANPTIRQESLAIAGALIGLAAVPSVAWGAARIVLDPIRGQFESRDLLVVLGVGLSILFVVVAVLAFVVTLSQVGLRTLDRRGGSALAVGHAIALGPDPAGSAD